MRPTVDPTIDTREETEPMTDTLIGPELREQARQTGSDLACREYDADLWFSEQPTELEFAKSLCADCPVRLECLTGALDRHEPWGVWGGEIFEKGNVVARKRPRGRPRKDAALIEQAAQAELAARTMELALAGVAVS
jgi:WhiB family redox-sensing transcriptional regulator